SRCVVNRFLQSVAVSVDDHGNTVGGVKDERPGPRNGRQVEWQTTARSENATEFPAAYDRVHPARRITTDEPSSTDRQLPDSVDIQQMTNVEIRVTAANAQVGGVADQTTRRRRVGNCRLIIDRVRPRVVNVELETARKAFTQAQQHAVVAGRAFVGDIGIRCELRAESDVRTDQTLRTKALDRIRAVADLHFKLVERVNDFGATRETKTRTRHAEASD